MERPICYEGNQAFIFVSYAHRDSERVWPIISRMQEDGFRVWYDDGIDPGTEWDENIASHVAGCGYFIAFLSENYLASNNCKDELNFSRDQGKPQLLIYLEDVQLPHGMAMRLGRNQAIFHNRYKDEEEFFDKLYDAQDIQYYNGTNKAPELKTAAKLTSQTFRTAKGKKTALWPILVAVLLITVAAVFFLRPHEQPKETPGNAFQTASDAAGEERTPVTNVLLTETDELKITALRTTVDSRYFMMTLNVKNKTKEDIYLLTDNCYLDGVSFEPDWCGIVAAGEDNLVELHWERETAERYGIKVENITQVKLGFTGTFQDDSGEIEECSCSYYPFGEENVELATYELSENDIVLLDTQEMLVAAVDITPGTPGEAWQLQLLCVNRTDKQMYVSTEKETLNGYWYDSHWDVAVNPGSIKYATLFIYAMDWMSTGYDQILSYTGNLQIYEWGSYMGEDAQCCAEEAFVLYPAGEEAAQVLAPREIAPEDLLAETESLRVAYLGSEEYNGSKADLIYLQNLNNHPREFVVFYTWEDNRSGMTYELDAFQEVVLPCYRVETVWGSGAQATLDVDMLDQEQGSYVVYDETFTFALREPDE